MELRSARFSERDEVLDLLAHWYDDGEFFARYNLNDPAFRDDLCLVAKEAGRIVSSVQIFDRRVNLDGQAVPMGGIGSVYTLTEYRKRGVASALMRLSLATMEREGFEVSLLFADRLAFYGGFGWSAVTRKFAALQNLRQIEVAGRFDIEPFDTALQLGEVGAIYGSYSGRFNSTATRDENYWRGNLRYAGNPGEYFVVCRAPGGPIESYARAIQLYGVPMIMEYGYRPGQEQAMLATFRHIAEASAKIPKSYSFERGAAARDAPDDEDRGAAPVTFVSHTAHDPRLETELVAAGCSLLNHEDNHFMWRVISPERLGRRFGMAPGDAADRVMAMVGDARSVYWTADRF